MKKLLLIAMMLTVLASCEKATNETVSVRIVDQSEYVWQKVSVQYSDQEALTTSSQIKQGYDLPFKIDPDGTIYVTLKNSEQGEVFLPIMGIAKSCTIYIHHGTSWGLRYDYWE